MRGEKALIQMIPWSQARCTNSGGEKKHIGRDTLQFWRADSGEPLSECVNVDHGRDENRIPLPLISFRNGFPAQRVAAVATPRGCVGPQLRLDRLEVAVLPASVHFLGHCYIRTRLVISYDCHTYPPRAGLVGDAAGSGGGRRTHQSTGLGKTRKLVGAVAAETWENQGRFEAGVAVAVDGWRGKLARRRYRSKLTVVVVVCSSWENEGMLHRGRCLRWVAHRRRWRKLCGGVYRQRQHAPRG